MAQNPTASRTNGLRIHCPRCRQPIEISIDGELSSLVCTACHAQFDVAGEQAESQRAEAVATVAHFQLQERIGMGGFGTVWKALDTQLDRVVALKIPRRGFLAAGAVDDFLREARIAAQLAHPNIARVFQIGRDGDIVYIVSQFMEGKTLDKWLADGACSQREIIELCVKICRALHYAHEQGVVHRDLKPQNVLMDEHGEPHITDFGLAKRAAAQLTMTSRGRILGTPAYISPEQASGNAALADRRSDIYSFGVMLFQLLTNELPFRGTVEVLIQKAIEEEPPRPRSLNSAIPVNLETICLKCLEKRRRRRYATAAEVADELERFLAGEPIHARPVGNVERAWLWCRRHPVYPVLFASLLLVLLLVHVAGWLWFERAYRQSDEALTARSVTGVGFAADSVAHTAQRELEDRFDTIERLARDPTLRRALAEIQQDGELQPLLAQLDDPNLPESVRDTLRKRLLEHPGSCELQESLRSVAQESRGVFGWFVLARNGLQVARWPANSTIGVNYAWRTYFHGEPHDFADLRAYRASSRPRIRDTHLSAAFVSQVSDRWVVAISTPVMRLDGTPVAPTSPAGAATVQPASATTPAESASPQRTAESRPGGAGDVDDRFLGVVSLMFELGQITELPGEESDHVFATIIDTRPGREGTILQHPLYEQLLRDKDRRLPDRFQDRRVSLVGWQATPHPRVYTLTNFRDPLGEDELGAAFQQRWLAARSPITVRGRDTGLWAVVQESYELAIGRELHRLRDKIHFLVAATGVLVVALVLPVWALVHRALR
ncbi:MAG: serine/threonine protein kinase [Pirellulales bacterium]